MSAWQRAQVAALVILLGMTSTHTDFIVLTLIPVAVVHKQHIDICNEVTTNVRENS